MNTHAEPIQSATATGNGVRAQLDMLQRRRRPALIALASILALMIVVTLAWPPTYRSEGTVLIEQQEIPDELVRASITSFADQRVRTISQRVMSTANLLEIIRKHDLYPQERRREPREKLLERMRDDIGLEMISADVVDPRQGRPTKATIAFTVSYDSTSPILAAKVANELTTLYLKENLELRRRQATGTADFLQEEVDRVGGEVTELEAQIADFKDEHADSLPELTQVNIQLMTRADEELRSVEARINSLDQQGLYLEAQLAQLEPVSPAFSEGGLRMPTSAQRLKLLRTQLASASALYGASHPDLLRLKREMAGLEREVDSTDAGSDLVRQLNDAKRQLAEARSRYSAVHPDVQRLTRVVTAIESVMRGSRETSPSLELAENPDNLAFIQVRAQREAALSEQASLKAQAAQIRRRIADYESRWARAPSVEREFSALLRDLQGAQFKYQEVRQKQMEAQVGANLESEQKGERFTLIDPPLVPEEPRSPNRPLLLSLGILLALVAAAGTATILERTDDTVSDWNDLASLVSVAPLATIPWIGTEEELATRQKLMRRLSVGAVTGGVMMLALFHLFVKPLDVAVHLLARRLGL